MKLLYAINLCIESLTAGFPEVQASSRIYDWSEHVLKWEGAIWASSLLGGPLFKKYADWLKYRWYQDEETKERPFPIDKVTDVGLWCCRHKVFLHIIADGVCGLEATAMKVYGRTPHLPFQPDFVPPFMGCVDSGGN